MQLKSIIRNDYFKNVFKLATGSTIAQVMAIVSAPITYRIYSKEHYGTLGLYMAIVGTIGVFSTLQYNQTILLEKNDTDSHVALWLNRLLNIGISLFSLLLVLLLGDFICSLLNNESLKPWLLLVPISVFFNGQNEIMRVYANRKKEYNLLTTNTVLISLLVPFLSISIGLVRNDILGLFIALLASQVLPSVILLFVLGKRYGINSRHFDFSIIKKLAKKNWRYPAFVLPSEFINNFTNQLPVFMISRYLNPGMVGVYNLCTRMLAMPINLITGAITEVFKQNASEEYHATGSCRPVFIKTLKLLSVIAIIPTLVILFTGPDLFAFVFGNEWRMAGEFARILIIMFAGKLIVSPLSYTFFIAHKMMEDFIWHVWMLVSNLFIFWFMFSLEYPINSVLLAFALNYASIYLIYIFRSYNFSVQDKSHL